ncbi:LysR family transcriptional regulator [Vibrio parahaemolyticus]|nr:LysR family transcriptional regulator [Vibrio parahaemolyticus]EHH1228695.1 LysR family transcriptional regulator [Vibrio parahaemolyticus]HAS6475987.1 LysR family transcriptional regulator [Vibrio parahaemolyticus]
MENRVNLNLINLLILLKKHKSMRIVAKILGKSESAISKDVAKLSNEFSEVLFVKTKNGFEPSYYLEQIYPELEASYLQLVRVVNKPIEFEPLEYRELIHIVITEAEYERVVASLYPKLVNQFPKAKLKLSTWNQDSLESLLQGNVDCAIHLQNERIPKDIYQTTLKIDQISAAIHRKHQIDTWDELKKIPFVFIDVPSWNEFNYRFEEILTPESRGDISYKIRVDKLKSALDIAEKSKIAIQLPLRYLNDNFKIIPYPNDVSFNIAYSFYCRQTEKHSPLITILQEMIEDCY